jgi:hypothetical protein
MKTQCYIGTQPLEQKDISILCELNKFLDRLDPDARMFHIQLWITSPQLDESIADIYRDAKHGGKTAKKENRNDEPTRLKHRRHRRRP